MLNKLVSYAALVILSTAVGIVVGIGGPYVWHFWPDDEIRDNETSIVYTDSASKVKFRAGVGGLLTGGAAILFLIHWEKRNKGEDDA